MKPVAFEVIRDCTFPETDGSDDRFPGPAYFQGRNCFTRYPLEFRLHLGVTGATYKSVFPGNKHVVPFEDVRLHVVAQPHIGNSNPYKICISRL